MRPSFFKCGSSIPKNRNCLSIFRFHLSHRTIVGNTSEWPQEGCRSCYHLSYHLSLISLRFIHGHSFNSIRLFTINVPVIYLFSIYIWLHWYYRITDCIQQSIQLPQYPATLRVFRASLPQYPAALEIFRTGLPQEISG